MHSKPRFTCQCTNLHVKKKNAHTLNYRTIKEKKLSNLIKDIINLKLVKKNGVIILHRHKKEDEIYPKELKILKVKIYGISKIIFGLVIQ